LTAGVRTVAHHDIGAAGVFEIGSTLREARVRRNLTLQQAEEDTKIRVKYLQAMENEDFDLMPGPTYAKAFLRTYSGYLDLDANVMLQEYSSRGGQRDHEPFGGSSMLGAPRSHRGRNTLVFVAVICLLVLAVIYVLGIRNGGSGTPPPITKPNVLGIGASPSVTPSHTTTPRPTHTATTASNVVRVNAATGDCWMEVRAGSSTGTVLYSSTLAQGGVKVFHGKTLWLRLGNPAALTIRVGGQTQKPIHDAGPLDYIAKDGKLTRTV
jgi:cytoskeleton protein RodZ